MQKIILIEGLDGCGKQTQADKLVAYLQACYYSSVKISFPVYESYIGNMIKMYLSGNLASMENVYYPSLLYALDRAKHMTKLSELPDDCIVVCDRYTYSNLLYQMPKLPECMWKHYRDWLLDLEFNKLQVPKPTYTLFLSVPVKVSHDLLISRYNGDTTKMDIHERDLGYLETCYNALEHVSAYTPNSTLISCANESEMKPVSEIFGEIVRVLESESVL